MAGNPTAGFAAYPHHVWTTAKPFLGAESDVDVDLRQVWIYGSHMQALDKATLKSALNIQEALVGNEAPSQTLKSSNPGVESERLSWGFHSPLMYWNNSMRVLEADDDVLRTINEQSGRASSSLNVPLRPASVFAGKRFSRSKLVAADALVVTLITNAEDDLSRQWRDKMASLASESCKDCLLFPSDGQTTQSRLYEFSFLPLSFQENALLAFAYGCMAVYVLLSLSRIKAFHSRFGLVVTAITQMTCSIMASLTVCGLLNINLSMIPQNAYPFLVLVIGLENMFRIINAVLAYPPTMATEQRIANALGDVGPVSAATAAQNLIILSLLGYLVSPGVAAFCAFACIATLFDLFFLFTFFIAVLNVDIRRFELQDAIARSNRARHRRKPSPIHQQQTWFDAFIQGRLPFSTRMAGTAVATTFTLSLNYHFFEHSEKTTSLTQLVGLIGKGPPLVNEFDTFASPPINASLTPGQWMRMQDFDTAKEVMRLAKPGADAFVIRMFAPLVMVLAGADRADINAHETWTIALQALAVQHFFPVAVAVVFAVAFVAMLMNILLYADTSEEPNAERPSDDELSVRTVSLPHSLDIVKLYGSKKGHFVSIGLDRTVALARFDRVRQCYNVFGLPQEVLTKIQWPIYQAAIDDSGDWVALHCANDQILIHGHAADRLSTKTFRYPDDNPPVLFDFARLGGVSGSAATYFTILTSGGRLIATCLETSGTQSIRLCEGSLIGAAIHDVNNQGRQLLVVSDQAELFSFQWAGEQWVYTSTRPLPVRRSHGRLTGAARIRRHSANGSEYYTVTTKSGVVFLDSLLNSVTGVMDFKGDESATDDILLGQTTLCGACGRTAVEHAALVHDGADSDDECIITTLRIAGEATTAICITGETAACRSFAQAQRTTHTLRRAGTGAGAAAQYAMLGLRRQVAEPVARAHGGKPATAPSPQLRERRRTRPNSLRGAVDEDVWEAYRFSLDGETETLALSTGEVDERRDGEALYVSRAGPAVPLDGHSVAVAFGNAVKIVRGARAGSSSNLVTTRRVSSAGRGLIAAADDAKVGEAS